jgi:fatty acid desaturase
MMNYSSFSGLHVHWLFGLALVLGAILFVVWAVRALNKKSLATWAAWLLIVGALGTILTSGWGMSGVWSGMHGYGSVNWQGMGQHMMDDDHAELGTAEEWQEHMLEEMKEHMGR